MILKDVTGFDVAIPGGFVRNVEGSLYGDGVAEFLERFRFDVAILSASGVAEDGTVSDDNHWEVDVVTRAMARSRRSILVIDHKKFDRSGYVELCHISEFDVLTTDCPPSEQMQDLAGSCQLLWPGCDQRPANGTV
jgi:DeoR family glycerol-3-phosphate regulon repressor